MKSTQGVCLLAIALILGCGPSNEQKAKWAEEKRIDCLDKICSGDKAPDARPSEIVIKLNGAWFAGPRDYFGPNTAFFGWWDRRPIIQRMRPPEAQALAEAGKLYDFSIEIFLQSIRTPPAAASMYDLLLKAEAEGRVIDKQQLRDGLEVWRMRDQNNPLWYVATQEKDPEGRPPVLACRDQDPLSDPCTTGFLWEPNIAADMRFRAKHAQDWPEIYKETVRVLKLLRRI